MTPPAPQQPPPAGLAEIALGSRSCPVCGSRDDSNIYCDAEYDPDRLDQFAFSSRKPPEYMHHRMVRCSTCDILYANPAPVESALRRAYRDAAYDSRAEAAFAARTYAGLVRPFLSQLPNLGRAMDIGAGSGEFVKELLALGFSDVVGVEPSRAPVEAAPPEIRSRLRQSPFRATDFTPGSHSLITCLQTIEHLSEPGATCRELWTLLEPGGAVLLVGHDYRSVVTRILGLKSPIFDIEHLQLFSAAGFRQLLERCGFTGVRVSRVVNRYPVHYFLRLLPIPPAIKPRLIALSKRFGVGNLVCPVPFGNLAAVGFKR